MVLSGHQRPGPGQCAARACCCEMLKHVVVVILDSLSNMSSWMHTCASITHYATKQGKCILNMVHQFECRKHPVHAEGSSGDSGPSLTASPAVQEDCHSIAVVQ